MVVFVLGQITRCGNTVTEVLPFVSEERWYHVGLQWVGCHVQSQTQCTEHWRTPSHTGHVQVQLGEKEGENINRVKDRKEIFKMDQVDKLDGKSADGYIPLTD